jgi:hypothetical protein
MTINTDDIPLDYKWINWDHLYAYVGRALLGDHVPMMTQKVADYLEAQAKDMKRRAEKLEVAAKVLRAGVKVQS